ncbi:hypothetical protein H8D30_02980 [bacterium]|nr:hypothetical protein [bacterium]
MSEIETFMEAFASGRAELPPTGQETLSLQISLHKEGHTDASKWVGWRGAVRASDNDEPKVEAALLHNIASFLLPDFDRGVGKEDAEEAIRATERALPLRAYLAEPGPLCWAWWDLGTARLAAADLDGAVHAFGEGLSLAEGLMAEDLGKEMNKEIRLHAAWLRLMSARALARSGGNIDHLSKGANEAAKTIIREGDSWAAGAATSLADLST